MRRYRWKEKQRKKLLIKPENLEHKPPFRMRHLLPFLPRLLMMLIGAGFRR